MMHERMMIVMTDIGLLIIRLVVGLTLMGHGSQKLFAWFGGGGLQKTGEGFEAMGIKPGVLMATVGGAVEFIGGLLFALGLLNIVGSAFIAGSMLVAIFTVHLKNGFWSSNGGFEYNLVLIAIAIGVGLTGPGNYSLDTLIF